jgi:hypothetical protein
MASIGTYIIAVFGYGTALLIGIGASISFWKLLRASNREDAREEFLAFIVGVAFAMFLAAVTRGLMGGL